MVGGTGLRYCGVGGVIVIIAFLLGLLTQSSQKGGRQLENLWIMRCVCGFGDYVGMNISSDRANNQSNGYEKS
jgi:hypothetical protein